MFIEYAGKVPRISETAFIAPTAVLVGDGSNATILAGATIGTGSVVAAGSVVTVDAHVPAAVVVAGAPARVRKTLAGRSADWIAHSSEETGEQMLGYRRDGIGDPHHHDLVSTGRRRRGGSPVQTRHE